MKIWKNYVFVCMLMISLMLGMSNAENLTVLYHEFVPVLPNYDSHIQSNISTNATTIYIVDNELYLNGNLTYSGNTTCNGTEYCVSPYMITWFDMDTNDTITLYSYIYSNGSLITSDNLSLNLSSENYVPPALPSDAFISLPGNIIDNYGVLLFSVMALGLSFMINNNISNTLMSMGAIELMLYMISISTSIIPVSTMYILIGFITFIGGAIIKIIGI